jgi:3-isopropylmalate dehydratase small subunit
MTAVEQGPATVVAVDLDSMRVTAGDLSFEATMPAGARDALTSGLWDGTGLLLENFDEVKAVAGRLPYVSSWVAG